MSGELVPLKPLPGRKKSYLVLAVGMAAGQEHGCRAAAWEEGFPACPVLLLPGGALGLLPGRVSIGGSGRGLLRDRSMATAFSCSQTCPPGAETLPLPASALPAWSGCPKPFSAHRLQCWSSHRCCGTVKEGGSGLGCSHGCTPRGLEWAVWGTRLEPLPKGSCMQQGAGWGDTG